MQHKLISTDSVQFKFHEGKQGVFSGYASTFNNVDSYGDTIYSGAYKKTIDSRQRPIQMLFNHQQGVIGKWLVMKEDEKGLYVEGELTPGHSKAIDVYASMMHGAVSGLSIGYRPTIATPNDKGGNDLYEIDLVEISVVESPADINAQVGRIKSMIDEAMTLKDIEHLLRDAGRFSKNDATALVSRIKKLQLGDQDAELASKQLDDILNFLRN